MPFCFTRIAGYYSYYLSFFGDLAQTYSVVLNGATCYGQLDVLSTTSAQSMTFAVDKTYSHDLTTRRYADVVTRVAAANLSNERTVFNVIDGVVAALDYARDVPSGDHHVSQHATWGVSVKDPWPS